MKPTDVKVTGVRLYLPRIPMRVPIKFGSQVMDTVTCARVRMTVVSREGRSCSGWSECVLSPGWSWPGSSPDRGDRMEEFCVRLARAWAKFDAWGHPIEISARFNAQVLDKLRAEANAGCDPELPHLAALNCASAFDAALADAFGRLVEKPFFRTCNASYMNEDLSAFLEPAEQFKGKYPEDFFVEPQRELPVWHLVGGKDPISRDELTGNEPRDGFPVLLEDWIRRDGLKCLKIKLRGNDAGWDYARIAAVGRIALAEKVTDLSVDFNCMVTDPGYVNAILDKLKAEEPEVYGLLLYVEQPFPYDLENNRIDVHSVSKRKPLFMDESAHDWRFVRLGKSLGWDAVALKSCKTLAGAILTLCWAKANGMKLMVQDLTNPRMSMLAHTQLAAYAGTIRGVECNAPQFYPAASLPDEKVYPGLYERRNGVVRLDFLGEPGLGIRDGIINIELPAPAAEEGES